MDGFSVDFGINEEEFDDSSESICHDEITWVDPSRLDNQCRDREIPEASLIDAEITGNCWAGLGWLAGWLPGFVLFCVVTNDIIACDTRI
jgi:hypothetical protein